MPPRMTLPSADASHVSALLGLADAPLTLQQARAARLALRFGGLGLRAADSDRHAAYWASWMDTLPAIHARMPSAAGRLRTALRADGAARTPSLLAATQAAFLTTQDYTVLFFAHTSFLASICCTVTRPSSNGYGYLSSEGEA